LITDRFRKSAVKSRYTFPTKRDHRPRGDDVCTGRGYWGIWYLYWGE